MQHESELLGFLEEVGTFERRFQIADRLNLFDAVGMVRQETKHSRFLGFLLTPSAPHGLGDRFLKSLLISVISDHPAPPMSRLQVAIADFGDAAVYFERDHFDISIHVPSIDLLFVIENKVDASERDQQLSDYRSRAVARYPGAKFVGAFLTPDGYQGEDSEWFRLSYRTVLAELSAILEAQRPTLNPEAAIIIAHYLDLIERHVVASQDLIDACKKIYAQHRAAIDLIVEHGQTSVLSAAFDTFVMSVPGVQRAANGNSYRVNFVAKDWLVLPGFQVADQSRWSSTCPVQFWFRLNELTLHLRMEVGPVAVNEFDRTGFVEALRKLLGEKDRKITGTYTRVARRSGQVTDDLDADEVATKMQKLWADLSGDKVINEVSQVARQFAMDG